MRSIKLIVIIVFILALTGCDEDNPVGGDYTLSLNVSPEILYNNLSPQSAEVTAILIKDDIPAENEEINFTVSSGEITSSAITNTNGFAVVNYDAASADTGAVNIRASFNDLEKSVVIHVLSGSISISVFAEEDTLIIGDEPVDCEINATLMENNEPIENAQVFFSTDLGEISEYGNTDNQGITSVQYTYEDSEPGTAYIEAEYDGYTASCEIHLIENINYELTVTADPDIIDLAYGSIQSNITAILTNNGNPVEGVQINFSATMGNISPFDQTDNNGIAESLYFYDGFDTGMAEITANYGNIQGQVVIQIINSNPCNIEVWSVPDTIYLGTGNYNTMVFAHLTDGDGNNIPNQQIIFKTNNGYITPEVETNMQGIAQTTYVYTGNEETVIMISASSQNVSAVNYIFVVEIDLVNLDVWADPDTIYEGTSVNYSDIYAELTDINGNPIADEQIDFFASVGSILGFGITNSLGIATTTFWYDERPDIVSTITAEFSGITETTTVTILTNQPQIVFLEADPLIIYADNDPETYSVITARIVDSTGEPMEDMTVEFETSPMLGYMDQTSALTNVNGYASSHLHDIGVSGLATVFVYCENDQSQIDVQIQPYDPPRGE